MRGLVYSCQQGFPWPVVLSPEWGMVNTGIAVDDHWQPLPGIENENTEAAFKWLAWLYWSQRWIVLS